MFPALETPFPIVSLLKSILTPKMIQWNDLLDSQITNVSLSTTKTNITPQKKVEINNRY